MRSGLILFGLDHCMDKAQLYTKAGNMNEKQIWVLGLTEGA